MLPSDPGTRHIPDATIGGNWFAADPHLQWLVRRTVSDEVWRAAEPALTEIGFMVPNLLEPLVRAADRHPPVHRPFDARGNRVDDIEFHPAYDEIERRVMATGALRAAHLPGWRGLAAPAPRALVTAMLYMVLEADQAITGCPIGMSDAMARCLTRNDATLAQAWVSRLTDDSGHHLRGAMFLTEKAGGSDVGANESRATPADDGTWRLNGEKWFASCPHSDLILVLARPDGAPAGPKGLGLFLMPRTLSVNERNSFVIHRLKEKFGTHSMASGEVGLRDAVAWQVGDIGRGMRQMMDMVSLTRVSIAAATAGAMRRNTWEALRHTSQRQVFGRTLGEQPLMRDTLAELVIDSTAALTGAIAVSHLLDRADAGDTGAEGAQRLLTPLLKAYLTERARITATEAMEIRGGNGYIEDWPDARILRDVYVHAIWEGSSNIQALDVLRALGHGAAPGFLGDIEKRVESADGVTPTAPLVPALLAAIRRLEADLDTLARAQGDAQQLPLRRLARRMAILALSAHLAEQGAAFAADTGSGRLAWIAARFAARLGGEAAVAAIADDTAWLEHADAIFNGNAVPIEVGEKAARIVGDALAEHFSVLR